MPRWYDKTDVLAVDDAVRGVRKFDQYFVRAGFKADDDDCLAAGIDEVPWRIVNGDVDMSYAWRDLEAAFAKNRNDAKVFRTVLNEDESP